MIKLRFLFLTTLLLAFISGHTQTWTSIDLNTTANLNEVYFHNDQVGYVLGNAGLLYRSTDGGNNWTLVPTGVTHDLHAITFVNDSEGYINGLKTVDGGNTWTAQISSEVFGLLYAFNSNRILAGHGDEFGGEIYESNDGGQSWNVTSNPVMLSTNGNLGMYNDIHFVNEAEGYLVTWYSDHLFNTKDTGASWNEIVIDVVDGTPWSSDDFRSVDFPTENIGIVTHESGILKTTDAGNTWSEIRPNNSGTFFYPESVITRSTNDYIVVGRDNQGTNDGKIAETTDGGVSWHSPTGTNQALMDIDCTTLNCFIAGAGGTLLKKSFAPVGVEDHSTAPSIALFPNPSTQFLNIDTDQAIGAVTVYDLQGRLVQSFGKGANKLDISSLKSGSYFLQIAGENTFHTLSFVKSR